MRKYQNRAIETAQVIEELIALAKDMRAANARGEALHLTEEAAEWHADEPFPDRAALVAAAGSASARLVADLRDAAADRWPPPPRKRA